MKSISIKKIFGIVFILLLAFNLLGQITIMSSKDFDKKPIKLEKNKVPKSVIDNNYREYPVNNYDNWFDNTNYTFTENPEYYLIESSQDNIPYKAIYSKTATNIAIHKNIKSDLPKAVLATVTKSNYKTWKIADDKEEIFKDSDKDQFKVYKVDVEKGKEKHTLFFQLDGTLLKDRKVS